MRDGSMIPPRRRSTRWSVDSCRAPSATRSFNFPSHYSTAKVRLSQESCKTVRPYLLNVVVRKGATVLKLLSSKDQALLVRGNALLVLNLGLDIVDRIGGLDLKGDGLARKGLDEAVVCQS